MRLLLVTLVLALAFVFKTGSSLPPVVASHFMVGGAVNGFMPHDVYLRFFAALLVGLPLFITLVSGITGLLPPHLINLPHRDYWLAPERQADTVAYLRHQGSRIAIILTLFLCFVHWLVVRANAQTPPLFPEHLFFVGLATLVLALVLWLGAFMVHFRRP